MNYQAWIEILSSQLIANSALNSITSLNPVVREILFQSKNEQTFSGILSQDLNQKFKTDGIQVMTEVKGVAVPKLSGKYGRNSHDLALLDEKGKIRFTLENKVWYHFDGSKGLKAIINPNVIKNLEDDIKKIKVTQKVHPGKGFLLLNIVTPAVFDKYESEHKTVLNRVNGELAKYKSECLEGFADALKSYSELQNLTHVHFQADKNDLEQGFLDIFCAEIS